MPKPKARGDWTDALFGLTPAKKSTSKPPKITKVRGQSVPHSLVKIPGTARDCPYCGVEMSADGPLPSRPTRDHVVPASLGYTLKDNKIICCFQCNQLKANRTLVEWLIVLARKTDPRNVERALRINKIIQQRHRSGLKIDVPIDGSQKRTYGKSHR